MLGKSRRHMLDNHDSRHIGGKCADHPADRLGPACRRADGDYFVRGFAECRADHDRSRLFAADGAVFPGRKVHFCSHLDLLAQIGQHLVEATGDIGAGFGDKIDCAGFQRLQCNLRPFLRQCADHDHRNRILRHQTPQKIHPVHARHFHVQRHHIRAKFHNFVAGDIWVGSRADHFQLRIFGQTGGQQLTHQCRIVDYKNPNPFHHTFGPSRLYIFW